MKTTKRCQTCKKEFKPFNSLQNYCSYMCAKSKIKDTVYHKTVSKIPLSPVYRVKNYIHDLDKSKHIVKEQMIKDKGYKYCQKCNVSYSSFWSYHHIVFRSEKPCHPLLHNAVNLIHLCEGCHNWFHELKHRRMYLVKERGLDEIFGNDIVKSVV